MEPKGDLVLKSYRRTISVFASITILSWGVAAQPAFAKSTGTEDIASSASLPLVTAPDNGSVIISVDPNAKSPDSGDSPNLSSNQDGIELASQELELAGTWTRAGTPVVAANNTIERYMQKISGLPVFNSEIVITRGPDRRISLVTGSGAGEPDNHAFGANPLSASEQAKSHVAASKEVPPGAKIITGKPIKGWFDESILGGGRRKTIAAYEVEVATPGRPQSKKVYVDANTGRILNAVALDHSINRTVCDGKNEHHVKKYSDMFCTDASPYNVLKEGGDPTGLHQDAIDVYSEFEHYEDYMRNQFGISASETVGWDAGDGHGKQLRATVRVCLDLPGSGSQCPLQNAFWAGSSLANSNNGGAMVFGEGFVERAITAHEVTHGLIDAKAGLIYLNQAGAINESIADVFGMLVQKNGDQSINPKWEMSIGDFVIRSMSDPLAKGDPDRIGGTYWRTGDEDHGNVHSNSGVGNKLVYLIATGGKSYGTTIKGLGLDKTAQLVYNTLQKLPRTSRYVTYGTSMMQTCTSGITFGTYSKDDCLQVQNALKAVGIGVLTPMIFAERQTVNAGEMVRSFIQMRELDGSLATGIPFDIYKRTVGAKWKKWDEAKTNSADGHFAFDMGLDQPTQFQVRPSGAWKSLPASNTSTIQVRSRVIKSRYRVARGSKKRGGLVKATGTLNASGKRIAKLQRYDSKSKRWRTVRIKAVKKSTFSLSWRAPRSLKRATFRVFLPANNGWVGTKAAKSPRVKLKR